MLLDFVDDGLLRRRPLVFVHLSCPLSVKRDLAASELSVRAKRASKSQASSRFVPPQSAQVPSVVSKVLRGAGASPLQLPQTISVSVNCGIAAREIGSSG